MSLEYFEPLSNMSCVIDCAVLNAAGPPPDMIFYMPPPPMPAFFGQQVNYLWAENESKCDLCDWANGNDNVAIVEIARRAPSVGEMWGFILVSACVGLTLLALLIAIAFIRYKDLKIKSVTDVNCRKLDCTFPKTGSSESVVYAEPVSQNTPNKLLQHSIEHPPPLPPSNENANYKPRPVWTSIAKHSSIRSTASPYAVQHWQSLDKSDNSDEILTHYEYVDYGSIGHLKFPNILPDGVQIATDGSSCYYANPESLDGSFDNGAYMDTDCSTSTSNSSNKTVEIRQMGPDGAVISPLQRGPHSLIYVGGANEAILKQRFENMGELGPVMSGSHTARQGSGVFTNGRLYNHSVPRMGITRYSPEQFRMIETCEVRTPPIRTAVLIQNNRDSIRKGGIHAPMV